VKSAFAMPVVLLVAIGASAQVYQTPLIPPHALTVNVVLFGHSWVERMEGYQPWAFPNIPSQHVSIQGYGGYNCAMLLGILLSNVPATTNAVFLITATNDVVEGVPVDQHIACMETMINDLIGENPKMLILVSNVPPLCITTLGLFGDERSTIAAYNQAYLTLPPMYPNNVKLVDMWTPMVDTQGWGLQNMFVDGVHPGPDGWDLVMGTIRDSLYANLPK
jgi:lysophospholipase L1-like esterase